MVISNLDANLQKCDIIDNCVTLCRLLTISMTLTCPYAKAIAFGGVATGSMKANEQAIDAEIIRNSGFTPRLEPCSKSKRIMFKFNTIIFLLINYIKKPDKEMFHQLKYSNERSDLVTFSGSTNIKSMTFT